jgi:hypothetical protein
MSLLLLIRGDVYRDGCRRPSTERSNQNEQHIALASMRRCLIDPIKKFGAKVSVIMDVHCVESLQQLILSKAKHIFGESLVKAEAHHERKDNQRESMVNMLTRNQEEFEQHEYVMIIRGDVHWKRPLLLPVPMSAQSILLLAPTPIKWGGKMMNISMLNDILILVPKKRMEEFVNWWSEKKETIEHTSPHLMYLTLPCVNTVLDYPVLANTGRMSNKLYRIIGRREATQEETIKFFASIRKSIREPAAKHYYCKKSTLP